MELDHLTCKDPCRKPKTAPKAPKKQPLSRLAKMISNRNNCDGMPLPTELVNAVMSKLATSVREPHRLEEPAFANGTSAKRGATIAMPSAACRQLLEPARAQVRAIGIPEAYRYRGMLAKKKKMPVPPLGAALKTFPNADTLDLTGVKGTVINRALGTVKDRDDAMRIKKLSIGDAGLDDATLTKLAETFPAMTDIDTSRLVHISGYTGPYWFEQLAHIERLDIGWGGIPPCISKCNLVGLTALKELRCIANKPDISTVLNGLTNLDSLDISYRGSTIDTDPIFALTKLTSLKVFGFGQIVGSVDLLRKMTGLESLDMCPAMGNIIGPIAALEGLTKLHIGRGSLDIPSNYAPLASLTNLLNLKMSSGDISTAPFAAFAKLTSLSFGIGSIRSKCLPQLEALTNLRHLSVSFNCIYDITPLANLKNLEDLNLMHTAITDIASLGALTKMRALRICSNSITDAAPLAVLTNLVDLNISHNELRDATPLAALTNLTHLGISYNRLTDVAPLAPLTNLAHLGISYNNITDAAPLAALTNLAHLDMSGTWLLTDATPLAPLTHMTHLSIARNTIMDAPPLAALTNLRRLNVSNNEIADATLLAALTNLRLLNVSGTWKSNVSGTWKRM